MNQALSGRRIVITRPAAQAGALCQHIESLGGEALRQPLIEIARRDDPASFARAFAHLRDYAQVFFVSANAIEHGLAGLRAIGPLPANLPVATVGPASAALLRAEGFSCVAVPVDRFDSEGVLALPAFSARALNGREVLIMRGDGGRELLAHGLQARGVRVDSLTCYHHRHTPPLDLSAWLAAKPDALTLTSSEAVEHLARCVRAQAAEALLGVPSFAPHPRIAALLEARGFSAVRETAGSDEGLCEGLVRFFSSASRGLGYHS